MAQVSKEERIIAAIKAYDADPSRFTDDQIRNLMIVAAQNGIPFEPNFSFKRAAKEFANEATFGLFPGSDFALRSDEAGFGTAGSILSFLAPVGAFKAAGTGVKAAAGLASGKARGATVKKLGGLIKNKRLKELGDQRDMIKRELSGLKKVKPADPQSAEKLAADIATKQRELGRVEAAIKRTEPRPAEAFVPNRAPLDGRRSPVHAGFDRLEALAATDAGRRAIEGAAVLGSAGAFSEGMGALRQGQEPFSPAIGGALGYGLLGAMGGPVLPYIKAGMRSHPYMTTAALGAGASGMMF